MKTIARNLVATSDIQSIELGLSEIVLLANDSADRTLIFSIDAPIVREDETFVLYPNEDASEYLDKCSCSVLYYKSLNGTVNFRIWGKPVFSK